jgi:hypothetical protein
MMLILPEVVRSPEFIEKSEKGPIAFMTVLPDGHPLMDGSLAMWFVYSIIVGILSTYIAGRARGPDAEYLSVFRFVACMAFVGYSLALLQNSIWYKRNWSAILKPAFDGLVYAVFTAGAFGWLWPS